MPSVSREVERRLTMLNPTANSPAEARAFLRRALADGVGDVALTDDALLVVSELVTNGMLHAATDLELTLTAIEGSLRIAVADRSGTLPVITKEPDREGGRGLALVSQCASAWGVESTTRGKSVWCELRPDTHP